MEAQTLLDRAVMETAEFFERKIQAHRAAIADRAVSLHTYYVGWPKRDLYLDAEGRTRGTLHAQSMAKAHANLIAARLVNEHGEAAVVITVHGAHQHNICTLRKAVLSLGKNTRY